MSISIEDLRRNLAMAERCNCYSCKRYAVEIIKELMLRTTAQELPLSYFRYTSPQKSIEYFSAFDYYKKPTEISTLTEADTTMTGIEYLAQNYQRQKYSHLRALLQRAWDITNTMPENRFDIDLKFKQDVSKIVPYLNYAWDREIINQAHRALIETYRQNGGAPRGRPMGARNKETIEKQGDGESGPTDVQQQVRDQLEQSRTELVKSITPAAPTQVDMSGFHPDLYLLRDVFEAHERANEASFNAVSAKFEQIEGYTQAINSSLLATQHRLNTIIENRPTVVTLERRELPQLELGVQHRHFPDLLIMCNARKRNNMRHNIWLHGGSGTGKSVAGEMVARALELPFYSLGALETGFQVLGYMDATGTYRGTVFRQAWEHGGVIMLDEIDSYTPSASLALNNMLPNGIGAFPDGMIAKHPDCIILGSANTVGLGGSMEFSARYKQDAAFLNRWNLLDWPHDNGLEDSLVGDKDWLEYVRTVRNNVASKSIKGVMITMRASIDGESLLAAGLSRERVIQATLRQGMTDVQWEQVS